MYRKSKVLTTQNNSLSFRIKFHDIRILIVLSNGKSLNLWARDGLNSIGGDFQSCSSLSIKCTMKSDKYAKSTEYVGALHDSLIKTLIFKKKVKLLFPFFFWASANAQSLNNACFLNVMLTLFSSYLCVCRVQCFQTFFLFICFNFVLGENHSFMFISDSVRFGLF